MGFLFKLAEPPGGRDRKHLFFIDPRYHDDWHGRSGRNTARRKICHDLDKAWQKWRIPYDIQKVGSQSGSQGKVVRAEAIKVAAFEGRRQNVAEPRSTEPQRIKGNRVKERILNPIEQF